MADNSEFMEVVQQYECIYNKFHKEYKNKFIKVNAWEKIGERFDMSPAVAEQKFKNIRTAYGRYLRKMKKLPSESGRKAVPPREFQNMDWLKIHISQKASTVSNYDAGSETSSPSNVNGTEITDDVSDSENEDDENSNACGDTISGENDDQHSMLNDSNSSSETHTQPSQSKTKKGKTTRPWAGKNKSDNNETDKALLKTANSLTEHLQKNSESRKRASDETECEDSLFLKSLIPRMKKLSPRSKAFLRINIEQLFFQTEFPPPPSNPHY